MTVKLVGIDDGHSGIKVCYGPEKYFYLPSMVSKGFNPTIDLGLGQIGSTSYDISGCKYICDGQDYEVLEFPTQHGKVEFPDSVFPIFPLHPINSVLIHHALKRVGLKGDVSIMTGLPFLEFFNETGAINESLVEKKKIALSGREISAYDDKKLAKILDHSVMPEATGSLYDLLLDFNGNTIDELYEYQKKQPVMIVDIGGKTTDIATFQHMQVMMKCSTTIKHGALLITREVSETLKSNFRLNVAPNINVVIKAINNRTYHDGEKEINVSKIVDPIVNSFVDTLRSEIFRIATTENIGRVYFVGGGSIQFKAPLQEMFDNSQNPKAIFVDKPEYSNARGFYKALVYQNK